MTRRVSYFCIFTGCREKVGEDQAVCRAHWLDLPLLLRRALTGARGQERAAARRRVAEWITTKGPVLSVAPTPAFHEPKDKDQ